MKARKKDMESKPIYEYIGQPALLEQLGEEACELGQASLKMARYIRSENPTPKTAFDVTKDLVEEVSDVLVCIEELKAAGFINDKTINAMKEIKRTRWYERLGGNENV
ncbi:hypothetical protein B5E79_00230 [Massilimicrobiota sp. An134]|nr:hypothetical protein B5E79_00230 [Massilimicrobiota sp. An134]